MSTKNVSARFDHEVYEVIKVRSKELGFPTPSDYLKSLVRYDLLIGKPHLATGDLHKQSVEQQSNFDRTLAAAYLAGHTTGGTYFERIFRQIVIEMGKEEMATPTELAARVQTMLKVLPPPNPTKDEDDEQKAA